MSREEQTQIFRGDDAPPEMAIAETGGPAVSKRPKSPVDERSLKDQEHGPSDARQLHDARDGHAEQRHLHDAKDELADLRKLHDADGSAVARKMQDADGQVISDGHGRADGPSDMRESHDGDGESDQRAMHDADGLSDQRAMHDAQGLSDLRAMHDAEGVSDVRSMQDHYADIPPGGDSGKVTLNQFGDVVDADPDEDIALDEADAAAAQEAPVSDPDLTFTVEDDATPWALSIHLEERIANLSAVTMKVNEQLDGLDQSIQRLAKRIGK